MGECNHYPFCYRCVYKMRVISKNNACPICKVNHYTHRHPSNKLPLLINMHLFKHSHHNLYPTDNLLMFFTHHQKQEKNSINWQNINVGSKFKVDHAKLIKFFLQLHFLKNIWNKIIIVTSVRSVMIKKHVFSNNKNYILTKLYKGINRGVILMNLVI